LADRWTYRISCASRSLCLRSSRLHHPHGFVDRFRWHDLRVLQAAAGSPHGGRSGDADDRDLATVDLSKRLDGGGASDEIGAFDHKVGWAKIDARSALVVRRHKPDVDRARTAGICQFSCGCYNNDLDGYAKRPRERVTEVEGNAMNIAGGVPGNENRGGRRSVCDAYSELAGRNELLHDIVPDSRRPGADRQHKHQPQKRSDFHRTPS
jgi:hypothetical protein